MMVDMPQNQTNPNQTKPNLTSIYILIGVGESLTLAAKELDCTHYSKGVEFQSYNYVHLWINTLGKGMNSLTYPQVMG